MLRPPFLWDRKLYGDLCRSAYAATKTFFARQFPELDDAVPAMVVAPQSFGNLANFHPHAHALTALGVFTRDGFPDLAGTNRRGGSPLTVYLSQPRRVSREAFLATECSGGARFVRGDVDGDGELKLRDVLFLLNRLFQKGDAPACAKTADANDDGRLNIADALTMVGHLFGDRGALAEPSLACGEDPTPDALACRSYPLCEA